ncbi:hypothetical protein L211DRAFT_853844 [Terfezia boudieri ATCC MYA-4762]|uniref:Uncharacterized protein n=1 Tax=Terfezia boudieri ATCC MYA-4762 TaxID=1051890 RepID=A0A3N4LBA4_9PEZI|nr:hypothetical protein L211DRAFT_853844 [Terfezia boudieri ATCC MYA-4762]
MKQDGIYGPQRAGTDAWTTFFKQATALPTMAPIGQINYVTNKSLSYVVNILAQDIAKKVCSTAVIRDKVVKAAREAHAAKYPDDPSLPILGKALQRKGMKGKQEDDWGEDENEDKDEDAEEPRQILKRPKRIVRGSKGIGYLKPVLKGDKGIVGVGTKGIVRPLATRTSKKVLHIEEDDEEEEEDALKNIKTRSGTGSVGGGKGIVRPQETRTSRKVLHIEEDDEGEEEEAPRNIKSRSGTGSVGGGKGIVRPQGTRTSKKVVIIEEDDEEEEEDAPKNIKTRSGTGSAGGGKGFVRPQVTQTSRKVVDDEEEEEAPTYIKTKIGTGSVEVGYKH